MSEYFAGRSREGRLGDELLPPSSAKPGLVMNKPAVAGACVRCARPSLTLLALRNTLARPGGPGCLRGSCSEGAPVEACSARMMLWHVGGRGCVVGNWREFLP